MTCHTGRLTALGILFTIVGLVAVAPEILADTGVERYWEATRIDEAEFLPPLDLQPGGLLPLHVSGRYVALSDGSRIVLRGVALEDPYWARRAETPVLKADLAIVKAWGGNAIHIPVHPEAWKLVGARTYVADYLDDVVRWAGEIGLYAIISWKTHGDPETKWVAPGEDKYDPDMVLARQAIATLATRYVDCPWVLYSVFNEPSPTMPWDRFRICATALVDAVREYSSDALVLVPGMNYAADISAIPDAPIDREGIIYTADIYTWVWNSIPFRDHAAALLDAGYPLLLLEWGYDSRSDFSRFPYCCQYGSTSSFAEPLLALCDEFEIGWTAWVWSHDWCPHMFYDYERTSLTSFGREVRDALSRHADLVAPQVTLLERISVEPACAKSDGCSVTTRFAGGNAASQSVVLTARSASSWQFSHWLGPVDLPNSAIASVDAGSQLEVIAVFVGPEERSADDSRFAETPIDLSAISWLASYDDEGGRTESNYADVVQGSDEHGDYYAMQWSSPEDTDLTIGGFDQMDRSGFSAIRLVMSSAEPQDVLPVIQVAGDYCGRTWRYATSDTAQVDREPRVYEFAVSDFAGDPFWGCSDPLGADAMEGLDSIILLPDRRTGELRVYDVALCTDSNALQSESEAETSGNYDPADAATRTDTDYKKGLSFGALWWPDFDQESVVYNLYRLVEYGIDSIAIHPNWFVESHTDPTLEPWFRDKPGFPDTNWWFPTLYDDEIAFIVETAHSLGMSVMIKLYVSVLDDPITHIGGYGLHPAGERWDVLFQSYQEFANHYAGMCEELEVEILCLGTELESMTHEAPNADARWREMIEEVRSIYAGKLTYSCAFGGPVSNTWSSPNHVTFWDALDFIGFEFYRGLTDTLDPSPEQLRAGVREVFDNYVEPLAREFDRPVLIPEISFMHCDGTNMLPYSPENPAAAECDYEEHAACYEAVLDVIEEISSEDDYFAGIFWWSGMLVDPNEELTINYDTPCTGTELWGTLAEGVVKEAWKGANGWKEVEEPGESIDMIIQPAAAADSGCSMHFLESMQSSLTLIAASTAGGWEFSHWCGDVDLPEYPITAIRDLGNSVAAVFRRSPCLQVATLHDVNLMTVDGFSSPSISTNGFWFAGGGGRGKVLAPISAGDAQIMRYSYPTDGSEKAALRFEQPFDASDFDGIALRIRANRETRIGIEIASQDRGLQLQENADDWKSSFLNCTLAVDPEERVFRIPFDEFRDRDWILSRYPDVSPGVIESAIWEIQILPVADDCILDILEVSFYRTSI